MHIQGDYYTEFLLIQNVGMGETVLSLEQQDAFLKTIRLYYEHMIRPKTVYNPIRDENNRPELEWAMKKDEDGDT